MASARTSSGIREDDIADIRRHEEHGDLAVALGE